MRNYIHPYTNKTNKEHAPDTDRIIRLKELIKITGVSKSHIYRSVESGSLPSPFRIGKRAVGWRLSAINAWLDAAEQAASMEG